MIKNTFEKAQWLSQILPQTMVLFSPCICQNNLNTTCVLPKPLTSVEPYTTYGMI